MACTGQIESHVALIMEARRKMTEAEDDKLSRIYRLQLLCDASNLIHGAMNSVGRLPNLRDMLSDCARRFLTV